MVWFPYKNFSSMKKKKKKNQKNRWFRKRQLRNFKISQFSLHLVTLVLNICFYFLKVSWYCVFGVPFIEFGWKLGRSTMVGKGRMISRKATWKGLAQSTNSITMIIDLSMIKTYPKLFLTQKFCQILKVGETKRVHSWKRFVFGVCRYTVSSKYIGTKIQGMYHKSTIALTASVFFHQTS